MSEVQARLYPCKHCDETGTCKSGQHSSSCMVCAKSHELKGKTPFFGLACGTCGGIGQPTHYAGRRSLMTNAMAHH